MLTPTTFRSDLAEDGLGVSLRGDFDREFADLGVALAFSGFFCTGADFALIFDD